MAVNFSGKSQSAVGKPFFWAALKPDGTLEIQVYEEIGVDYPSDDGGVTAKTVARQIDAAGNYSRILLRINSPGGDVFEGLAIYNLIRAQEKPVEVCVDGIAASAASIIAMCGDTITMGPNAMMMIHNAWSWCMGFASDMRKMADALDKISDAVAQTYVARTGKSLDEISALMEAETWLSAQECIEGGFATRIVTEADDREQAALAMARRFKSLERLKRVPERLWAAADDLECGCECQNCQDDDCQNCTNVECEDPNCTECPMQSGEANNLSLYEARAETVIRRMAGI